MTRKDPFWKLIGRLKHYLKIEKMVILVCCITYLFIMIIIGRMFNEQLINEYSQLVKGSVQKQLESESSYYENYLVLASMIMSDGELLKMLEEDVASDEILNASYKLGKYKLLLQHISEIYLYDANTDIVFASNGTRRALADDRLVEDEFREKLNNGVIGYKENFLVRDNSGSLSAIAHVFYLDRNGRYMIVLDDYQIFKEEYEYCEYATDADIIVAMKNGEVIYGNETWPVGAKITNMQMFQDNGTNEAYQIKRIDNQKNIVTYDSDGNNRIVISMRPYAHVIINNPFDKKWMPLYVVLIILVAQMLAMEGWIRVSLEKMRRKILKENTQDAEKIYLLEYLENPTFILPEKIKNFCDKKFGVGKEIGFIILHLDSYEKIMKENSPEDINLYKFAINNICEEIFSARADIWNLRWSEDEILYMYSLHRGMGEDSLKKAAEECNEYIHGYINFDTSYFISSVGEPESLTEKYREAYHIQEYVFIHGKNSILFTDVLESGKDGNLHNVLQMCNELGKCIEENASDKELLLDKVIRNMYELNSIEVHEAVFQLIIILATVLKKLETRKQSDGMNIMHLNLISTLNEAKNLDEVQILVSELFEQLDSFQEKALEIKRSDRYVKRVQKIIAEKYSQSSLYTEGIAEELGITGKHLGKIFKAATGISISQALTNKRLEEAEKLLREGELPIREVAVAVGYTDDNSNYFSTLFKKKYGRTPTDYRMENKGEKEQWIGNL